METTTKPHFKRAGIIVSILLVLMAGITTHCTPKPRPENNKAAPVDSKVLYDETKRVAQFMPEVFPDDQAYWSSNLALKQLGMITGKKADLYQDEAHFASAWSYIFYGLSYVPMCYYNSNNPHDLAELSKKVVVIDASHRYTPQEVVDLQIRALKAQTYFHHAQGLDSVYREGEKLIEQTVQDNKSLNDPMMMMMNNYTTLFKLTLMTMSKSIAFPVVMSGKAVAETKQTADQLDSIWHEMYQRENTEATEQEMENWFTAIKQTNALQIGVFADYLRAIPQVRKRMK